jgi:glycosyltransferase involved in cell wall biosynthesis
MKRRSPQLGEMTKVAEVSSSWSGGAEAARADVADPRAGSPSTAPRVVYIAGSSRSGSTLLERVLGGIPGFVNVGELIDLFRWDIPRGERCGCGQPFASCPFWASVGKRAFDDWEPELLATARQLRKRVARQRHLPRLIATPLAGRRFRANVTAYGACYERLYQVIAAEADAAWIVDASKWPVQALALSRAGIDVRVIHLVRDVRGVAYSLSKQGVARPHSLDKAEVMWSKRPMAAAARWLIYHCQVELLPWCGVPVTRVRYEDFVHEPRRAVEMALAGVGLPPPPSDIAHIGKHTVTLGSSHGISGNPSRFRHGEIMLRTDDTWREKLPLRDRIGVTAIGLPLLVRYGWRPRLHCAVRSTASSLPPPTLEREWPQVSVIIPTHGRPELVRESIASVVAQTYPGDIECIVVHDQEPPDQDLISLGTERHRVRAIPNSHVPGLAGARNTGLDHASSEYIATCDDDDLWHPDKLKVQVGRLLDEPDLLVVGSGMRLLLPNDKTLDWPGRAERISYQLLLRNRVKELHSSTLVMRREVFTKVGQYDEELPRGYAEDYDWVLRAAQAGPVGMVRQPLADIRRNARSWYQGNADDTARGLEYMLRKHPDIAASPRGHARMLGQIAFARSSLGERGPALHSAMKALSRWPLSPHPYIALIHVTTGINPKYLLRAARLFRRDMA